MLNRWGPCESWGSLSPLGLWLTHGLLNEVTDWFFAFFRIDETHDGPGFSQWNWLSL